MRLVSRIREASWTQVCLELVVVVVGILLALGIDSWWAERQERAFEVSILEQLEADLAGADAQLSGEVVQTEAAAQAALNLLLTARGELDMVEASVVGWLTQVSWWSDPYPTTASAQALVSSNSLHVIQSDSLRSSVVTFLDRVHQLESRIPRHEREITDWMNVIGNISDPLTRGPVPHVGILSQGVEESVDAAMTADVTSDLRQALRDLRFQRATLGLFWAHENLRWLQQTILDATHELRAEVRSNLESMST